MHTLGGVAIATARLSLDRELHHTRATADLPRFAADAEDDLVRIPAPGYDAMPPALLAECLAVFREPGALTAAIRWYRALPFGPGASGAAGSAVLAHLERFDTR